MWKNSKKLKTGVLFCIRWRYLIALLVFVVCVALKVHGSSINEYNKMFDNYPDYKSESIIVGKSREVRTDEYKVHTPYYMSQYYNDFAKNSNMMSLGGQDMIVGYNAPVKDVSILSKPFTWGYVLLGNEYGLSWYWCSKLILLMLVSFELCMIITRGNKKVSLLGMLMVSFAPSVQWWFVPHIVDVLFWGMAITVLAYHFFMSKGWKRILFMILLPLATVTFVLALFPSLQIPVGLVALVLFVTFLIRDKKDISFKKKDIWMIVVMILFCLGILGYTIWSSKDAILILSDTAYPGHRVSLGGNFGVESLFTDLTSFALPYKDITYLNNCEVSSFIHFAPLFLMLYPTIYWKMRSKKNMIVGNVLVVCIAVMAVFMLVGFPELIAKITGFSYINRMDIAYGWAATIFTVWGIDMIWQKKIFSKKQIAITMLAYGFLYVCFVDKLDLTYLSWKWYSIIIALIMLMVYLLLTNRQKLFLAGMTIVMVISGMTINPIARGEVALFGHPIEQKIHEIASAEPDECWLAVNDTRLASIGIANGARVLNAVNFYPDFEKWSLLDPEKESLVAYNRYAHIEATIADDGKTKILESKISPDITELKISYKDLAKKWPIKYLISAGELKGEGKYYNLIYKDAEGEYYIYERKNE